MSGQTRWFVLAVCSLVVVALISLTAIDKRDEQSCRSQASASLWSHECGGFLPW